MTFQLATILSCVLFPLMAWAGLWAAKRTIYYAAAPEEGAKQDEGTKRERVKALREKNLKRLFMVYGVIVLVLYGLALVAEPAKKVQAALWPTATPTQTFTPSPTITRTPSRTPAASRTPTVSKTGTSGAGNFLTTIAGGTPGSPTATQGGGVVIQTRVVSVPMTVIVKQTQVVIVTVVNYVVQTMPVTVVVIATNTTVDTPPPTATVVTATPSLTYTVTVSPSPTPTATWTPTSTHTPTATFITPTVQQPTETPTP